MSLFRKLPRLSPRARLALLDLEDRVVPANIVVLNTLDVGTGSLRAAITEANSTPGIADTITFDANVFSTNQTIFLDSALPTIATPMTITGPGSSLLTLSKLSNPNPFSMLDITDGNSTSAITVAVSGIKITGNAATVVKIANETVTLSNVLISGATFTGSGGGVSIAGGTVTVTSSSISGNSIVGTGGGIAAILANSTIILDHSTLDHNTASSGGGIGFAVANGSLNVTASTISNNVSNIAGSPVAPGGAGILFQGTVGTSGVFIRNSTLSGNTASTLGGGADFSNLAGTVNIQNTTVTNNRAFSTSSNAGTGGGGIAVDSVNTSQPVLNIASSIISGNVASNGRNDIATVLSGMTFILNTSAVGDQGLGTDYITPAGSGNLAAALSTVAALALNTTLSITNGGTTPTHTLGAGSSANNAGSNPANLSADQNDNPRSLNGGVDIGSVERINVPTTYAVLNTNDSGSGSFRQAIRDANANANAADTIVFEATVFGTARTITLTSGELAVDDSLTITGPGRNLLTISGGNSSRIFKLDGSGVLNIALSDMTLTKGNAGGGSGGAILDQDENLALTRMTLTGNRAGINGGALQLTQGQNTTVTLQDCTVSSNSASSTITSDGGGIAILNPTVGADAALVLNGSIVAGNSAADDGGGMYLESNTSLLLESSLLNDNVCGFASKSSDGGGLAFNGSVGSSGFVIRNSTITGNTAKAIAAALPSLSSGGLGLSEVSGTITIVNSTIVSNSSGGKSTGAGQGGGGVAITGANSHLVLQSTVVALNTSSNGRPDLASQSPVDYDHSAIGSHSGFSDGAAVNSNIAPGTDLKLAVLTGNGGTSRTVALRPGSPLIDTGSYGTVTFPPLMTLTTDQRGSGFARQAGNNIDIGAFERVPGIPLAIPTAPVLHGITASTPPTSPFVFTITYTSDTPLNLATIGSNDILVTGPNGFSTLATFVPPHTGTDNLTRTATYSFTPPGGFWNAIDNGEYIFNIQPGSILTNAGDSVFSSSSSSMFCIMPTNFIVTVTDDSGPGSLRDAVGSANSNGAGTEDIVSFSPNFSNSVNTINLIGEIPITDSVKIQGPGANLLTVSGGNASRIFTIDNGDLSQITATISGLTLSGGSTAGDGGAIQFQDEILNLVELHVTASKADGSGGGLAASSAGAILNVTRSTIANNKAGIDGGGAFMTGAILGGTATILNSTLAKNTATGVGGGYAGAFGGGVGIGFTLDQSTLTTNSSGGAGGGFRLGDNTLALATLNSTIVSGNSGGGGAPDIALANVTSTYSAIGNAGGYAVASKFNDLVYGAALNLGLLTNNGGPTPSVALGAGSAAINTGTASSAELSDQRTAGFARLVNTNLDIGAYEVQPAVTGLIVNGGAAQRSRIVSIEVVFDADVTAAVFNLPGAVKLTRTAVPNIATGTVGDVIRSGETAFSAGLITVAQGATNSLLFTFSNTTDNMLNAVPETVFVENTSLTDGYWKLTIGLYNSVTGSLALRRLYGDMTVTAGGTVDGADLVMFGNNFSTNFIALDFNNDGTIDGADLTNFGNHFSRTL